MGIVFTLCYVAALSAVLGAIFYRAYDRHVRMIEELKRKAGEPSRLDYDTPGLALESHTELARSIEAIALEVERISEGQRFVTKLLAERNTRENGLSPKSPIPAVKRHPTPPAT